MTTPHASPPADWLSSLGRNRQPVAVALMAAGAILEVVALVLILTLRGQAGSEAFGCFLLGVGCFCAGLWFYLYQENAFTPAEAGRFLVLLVGGALGLSLTLAILARAWQWRETIFGGLEAWQGSNGWRVWLVLAGTLVGLAIMFGSLLLARTEEQSNPSLRRMLYGYNAFLSGFLLLIVLIIANLVAYQYIPARADYTDLKIYTLNPKSENILKGLDKPVKVYVILDSPDSVFANEVQNLENNIRNFSNQIRFENIVRDLNVRLVAELTSKYNLVEALGMLVVYGTDEESSSHFIKADQLFQQGAKSPEFQGENELMSAITFLQENKTKPILYFTQANDELDLQPMNPGAPELRKPDRRAALLKEQLTKDNYDVRGLRLGAVADRADTSGAVA
ncbi:MAG TPA: Gldg family protein, partial [Gemmataceae bacterium]